jgi:hypothetical protein
MGTPIEELSEPDLHLTTGDQPAEPAKKRLGARDDEQPAANTLRSDSARRQQRKNMERLTTTQTEGTAGSPISERLPSPSRAREEAHRLGDDLALLQAERQVSVVSADKKSDVSRSRQQFRRRSREMDDYDLETTPSIEKTSMYRPPDDPNTGCGRAFKKIHDSIWLVRYFLYIMPVFLILLIPLLLGILVSKDATVGDVRLMWFSIWLEIVWLSLWAARVGGLLI